jgi:outer membrane receptor protein involved in Fe transport
MPISILNWVAAGAMMTAIAAPAYAQQQSQGGAPPAADNATTQPSNSPTTELAEIIVTAQRRSESLQRVPIAITAVTGANLTASGIRDATDLAVATSSLQSNVSVGYFLPRLRGIGSTATGAGIEGAVASYIDNVYIASAPAPNFAFNNVERVEILKGPQGTLFGRNATGGVINIITKDPSHTTSGDLEVSYGNYDTVSGSAYITGALSDTAAIDLAATGSHQGNGYGTYLPTGADASRTKIQANVRSKLLWEPTSSTQIRLSGDYAHSAGDYPNPRDLIGGRPPAFGPAQQGSPWDSSADYPTDYHFEGGGVTLRADQSFDASNIVSISAYRKSTYRLAFDFDTTPTPALAIVQVRRDRQFSQELQIQSNSESRIKWVTGAYYFNARSFNLQTLLIESALQDPASPFFPVASTDTAGAQTTESIAGFAQATIPLGPSTNLTGGFRYTHDTRKLVDVASSATLIGGTVLPTTTSPSQSKGFGAPTWRLSLDQQIVPGVLAYVSYNRGFKSGGYNAQIPTDPEFKPEKIDAYEAGMKADLFDRRLRLNPALFNYNYKNIQVPIVNSSGGLGITNGPSAKVWGAELEGEALFTSNLRVTFGLTYLHDRFGDYPGAIFYLPQLVGYMTTKGNAKGNRLPFTADLTTTLGFNYTVPLAGGSQFVIQGDWGHNDSFYTDSDNLRRQRAYNTVNASARWTSPGGQYWAGVWGKNLANDAVLTLQTTADFAAFASYAAPRTFGVTVGTTF